MSRAPTQHRWIVRIALWFAIAQTAAVQAHVADATPPSALPQGEQQHCERMKGLQLANAHIVAAEDVAPHPAWTSPASLVGAATVRRPFCRLQGIIEREIRFELWLPPPADWNGRYLGAGNGGDAGFINYPTLARGVMRGFAAASTDTGHTVEDLHWALGHPDRLENYGFRAHHWLAVVAKEVIREYYGSAAKRAYFLGCSGGGAQAMNEAQRYPADYDGIIAGASGYSMAPLSARFLLSALLAQSDPAGSLTEQDWKQITHAALERCDALDGLKDGIIQDPRRCDIDPAHTPGLTPAKARQAGILLGPLRTPDGRQLYPGFAPGAPFTAPERAVGIATRFFGEWVYQDKSWDPHHFDLARDTAAAENRIAGLRFANPDLEPLARRGGKLISYVGWSDPIVPALANIDYYERLTRYLGPALTAEFSRLFLVPGMGHCQGGDAPVSFGQAFEPDPPTEDAQHDVLTAMLEWVEQGRAPDQLIATQLSDHRVLRTRPLCAYPKVARYNRGDPNDSGSFRCESP